MDCLNGIIGAKSTTTVETPPAGFDQSTSGLFLLDFTKLQLKREACETVDTLNQAQDAIKDAVLMTCEALGVQIGEEYDNATKVFRGLLGGVKTKNTIEAQDYVGLRLESLNRVGQYITLKRITAFSTSATGHEIRMYKNQEYVRSYFTTTSGGYVDIPADEQKLVLADDQGYYDYEFIYDLAGAKPYDNETFGCDCDRISRENKTVINQYLIVEGIKSTDPDTEISSVITDNSYGLSLDIDLRCDGSDMICKNMELDDNFGKVMAWTVLYKAAECFVQMLLDSGEIDRLTLLSRESLYGKRNSFQKQFTDRVEWLTENVDLSVTSCYVCGNPMGISKGTILA